MTVLWARGMEGKVSVLRRQVEGDRLCPGLPKSSAGAVCWAKATAWSSWPSPAAPGSARSAILQQFPEADRITAPAGLSTLHLGDRTLESKPYSPPTPAVLTMPHPPLSAPSPPWVPRVPPVWGEPCPGSWTAPFAEVRRQSASVGGSL